MSELIFLLSTCAGVGVSSASAENCSLLVRGEDPVYKHNKFVENMPTQGNLGHDLNLDLATAQTHTKPADKRHVALPETVLLLFQ